MPGAMMLVLKAARAAPSRVVGSAVASADLTEKKVTTSRSGPGLAAVPLPIPMGASSAAPVVGSLVPVIGSMAPDMGNVGGSWVLGWWAAAGGALSGAHGIQRRTNNKTRRRRRGVAGQARAAAEEVDDEVDVEEPQAPTPVFFVAQGAGQQQQYQGQHQQFQQPAYQGHVDMGGFSWQPVAHPMVQMAHQPSMDAWSNNVCGVLVPVGGVGMMQPAAASPCGQQMVQLVPVQQAVSHHAASSSSCQLPLYPPGWHSPVDATSDAGSASVKSSQGSELRSRWSARDADAAVVELRAGDSDGRRVLLERITMESWPMALTRHGCRVLQVALEVGSPNQRQSMASAMRGRVWEAMRSPHANHVLQKMVMVMPPDCVVFMIEELRGRVGEAARHAFGCRVLERLLEHCPIDCVAGLLGEVRDDAVELSRHAFGNYVVQHAFEHGSTELRHEIVQAMLPEICKLARHKSASHCVESALLHCCEEDRQAMKLAMAGDTEELASLTSSNFGSFVVKEMRKR